MIPYLLLLVDCILWNFSGQWLIFSATAYFTIITIQTQEHARSLAFYNALIAFLLEDFLINGRFGLGLVYAILLTSAVLLFKEILLNAPLMLGTIGMILFFLFEDVIIKNCLFSTHSALLVTSIKILINVGISVLVIWGRRGNRLRN